MMEIPAGKWCYCRNRGAKIVEGCPFNDVLESDEGLFNVCGLPDFADVDIVEDIATYQPLRCLACLSAYPNGAVIEIKPK